MEPTTKSLRKDEFAEAVERVRLYVQTKIPQHVVECLIERDLVGITQAALGGEQIVCIDVPNTTLGDYITAKGAMMDAATFFVDWERLHNGEDESVSAPGRIIMQIANRLPR